MDDFGWEQQMRREMKIDRRHFSRLAFGFLFYDLLGAGLQFGAAVLLQFSGWDYSPYWISLSWILNLVVMYVIAMPIAACYFKKVPRFGQVRNERWEFKAWVVVFFIGLSMGYLGNLLGTVITSFTGAGTADYDTLMDMIFDGNMFLTFLNVVIGAPIVEELLFRKILIDRTIGYGERFSVLLSGTLFGLMHGNFQQFFYAFALGCLFAYIYCKTGKIRNTILFHMWINFCGSILVPLLMRGCLSGVSLSGEVSVESVLSHPLAILAALCLIGYVLFQLLSTIAGLVLFFVFKRFICFYPGLRQIPKGRRFRSVVVNPGMVLFLLLCIWQFF